MTAVLGGLYAGLLEMMGAWWRGRADESVCRSCGTHVEPPLDECLKCLSERHW
jgi:uncharacterized OB-fold protein